MKKQLLTFSIIFLNVFPLVSCKGTRYAKVNEEEYLIAHNNVLDLQNYTLYKKAYLYYSEEEEGDNGVVVKRYKKSEEDISEVRVDNYVYYEDKSNVKTIEYGTGQSRTITEEVNNYYVELELSILIRYDYLEEDYEKLNALPTNNGYGYMLRYIKKNLNDYILGENNIYYYLDYNESLDATTYTGFGIQNNLITHFERYIALGGHFTSVDDIKDERNVEQYYIYDFNQVGTSKLEIPHQVRTIFEEETSKKRLKI